MNILFLGGDKRYKYMMEELTKKHMVCQMGFDNIEYAKDVNIKNINLSEFNIVIFPISGINNKQEIKCEVGSLYLPETLFSNISKKTLFYTGVKTKKLLELVPNEQLISFLDFEEVKNVNDSLTVERSFGRY